VLASVVNTRQTVPVLTSQQNHGLASDVLLATDSQCVSPREIELMTLPTYAGLASAFFDV
jgi:hypothetical protein